MHRKNSPYPHDQYPMQSQWTYYHYWKPYSSLSIFQNPLSPYTGFQWLLSLFFHNLHNNSDLCMDDLELYLNKGPVAFKKIHVVCLA